MFCILGNEELKMSREYEQRNSKCGNLLQLLVLDFIVSLMQAIEFFFFAILIAVVAVVFAVMAYFYKYVDLSQRDQPSDDSESPPRDETSALILDKENAGEESKQDPGTNITQTTHSESEF